MRLRIKTLKNYILDCFCRKPQDKLQDDNEESVSSEEATVTLRIYLSCLGVINLQVSCFDSGLQVKERVIKKLEASSSPSSSFSDDTRCYKLVRSRNKRIFKDDDLILSCNVKNLEEFLMLVKRADNTVDNLLRLHNSRGPTEKEILTKTRHIPMIRSSNSNTISHATDAAFFQGDLQHDLRKILSEIAKYSAYILGSLPYAEKLITYYRQKILMSLYNHQDVVKLLVDMV